MKMTTDQLKENKRWFFGYAMQILRGRGFDRNGRKKLIRESGLVEKCKTENGALYVLHYDVYDWVDYMINGNKWPRTQEEREWYAAWGGKTPTAKSNLLIFEQEHGGRVTIGA